MAGVGRTRRAAVVAATAAGASASLARLHAGECRLDLADKPVERAVAILRSQLGLPLPDTS